MKKLQQAKSPKV
jgi:hypothetical protein